MPEATGSGFQSRAGALTLMYLASPMERNVLRTLLAEACTGVVLQEIEPPSPEYLALGIFQDPYILEPVDPDHDPEEPIGPDTVLRPTPAGRELAEVGGVLERWLRRHPAGRLTLESDQGQRLGPLLTGWVSTVVHTFAGAATTVDEAAEVLQIVPLESIEARAEAMERAGLLRALPGAEDEPRLEPTEWLRLAVAPLAAAARLELRHPPGDTAPIAALDVEAAFKLSLPLLRLPRGLTGTCALTVELDEDVVGNPISVTTRIERRHVVSVVPGRDEQADSWAAGTSAAWLDAVIDHDTRAIDTGGDERLAGAILGALHRRLF